MTTTNPSGGPETVIAIYRVQKAREDDFMALLREHHPTLLSLELATPDAPVVYRGQERDGGPIVFEIFTWVDQAEYVQLRSEFYDEDGWLASTLTFSDLRDFDGRILPGMMEMVPADKEGHRTVIRTLSTKFEVDLAEQFFRTSTLRNIR